MIIIIDENEVKAKEHSLNPVLTIDSLESLYHNFEQLKMKMGADELIIVHPEYIDLVTKFPFDLYFLTGGPIGENPSTYVDTSKYKTLAWTDYQGALVVQNATKDSKDFEQFSESNI